MPLQNIKRQIHTPGYLLIALVVSLIFPIAGCSDFWEAKTTELETRKTLDEISRIPENLDVNNPLPELYRTQPKRISTNDSIKLFYFTKNHSAEKLAELLAEQFPKQFPKIKDTRENISSSNATNQLILDCQNNEQADIILEFLKMIDVPPIQVNIDCIILERYADVTMDWETRIMVQNLLGEDITLGGKTQEDGTISVFPESGENILPTFPGAALRESKRREFGLNFGYWRNKAGHQLKAAVDLLISRGYLKVLMNPSLETVNGRKAKVTSRENVGLEKLITDEGQVYSSTEYQWVEDSLEVTPHVFADGSIGLETYITLGAKSKPEGVVQTSIITETKAEMTENRIAPGQSLVIAGIRKTMKRGVIRGVPFLKDIPVIGALFSSKDYEERATEVIFILTPSISSGGIEYTKMLADTKEKYATPKYKSGLEKTLTDPFGLDAYTELVEEEAAKAQLTRLKAQLKEAKAKEDVELIRQKLLKMAEQMMAVRQHKTEIKSRLSEAIKETEEAKKQIEEYKAKIQTTDNSNEPEQ